MLQYAVMQWSERGLPILLLLTIRQEALTGLPEVQSWLSRLNRDDAYTEISLSELTLEETEQVIQGVLQPVQPPGQTSPDAAVTRFAQWLFSETEGQPLFLTETLKSLVDEKVFEPDGATAAGQIDWEKLEAKERGGQVAPGIQTIIQGWLARISPAAKALLTAAAVLGTEASFDHLRSLAGLPEIEALEALDELLEKQLLLEGESQSLDLNYHFSHAKVSDVVYGEAGRARLRRLHRLAFEALEKSHVAAGELVPHAQKGGLAAETLRYSLIAGDEAMGLLAHQVAVVHYKTALNVMKQHGEPAENRIETAHSIYTKLGRGYVVGGAWELAKETFRELIAFAQEEEQPLIECLGLNRLAHVSYYNLGEVDESLPLLLRARSIANQLNDLRAMAETESNIGFMTVFRDIETGVTHADPYQALALARRLEDSELIGRNLTAIIMTLGRIGQFDEAIRAAEETIEIFTDIGHLVDAAENQSGMGNLLFWPGYLQKSVASQEKGIAFLKAHEIGHAVYMFGWMFATALNDSGQYGRVKEVLDDLFASPRLWDSPVNGLVTQLALGIHQRHLMAFEAADETFHSTLKLVVDHGVRGWIKDWFWAELSAFYAVTEAWATGYPYAKENVALVLKNNKLLFNLTYWRDIEILLQHGDEALARAAIKALDEMQETFPRFRFIEQRSRAVLARWDEEYAQAIKHLELALGAAREIGLAPEEWSILGELGELYAAQGEPEKGQKSVAEAAKIIQRLADSIGDSDMRSGFLSAEPVKTLLAFG